MGYSEAHEKLQSYWKDKMAALKGERKNVWFSDLWDGISDMLKTFDSKKENKDIVSSYVSSPSLKKVPGHVRLDYVCGLRREVRKQYISGDGDIYTDVTPFRHGVTSANGASMFNHMLDTVGISGEG